MQSFYREANNHDFNHSLQNDGTQNISDIVISFPGGQLRLIDGLILFLFKKAEDETARRSDTKIQLIHDKSLPLQSNKDLCKDTKGLSHADGPFLQVIRNTCSSCMRLLSALASLPICVCEGESE